MKPVLPLLALTWATLWFSPDQQGQRSFNRGGFAEAAAAFEDPAWKGVALYRAGEYEKAVQAFSLRDAPEAHFNKGNALVFLGQYNAAVASYDKALEGRPGWREAEENRTLAQIRAERLKTEGGDMGEQEIGADEIVFDRNRKNPDQGQETEVEESRPMSDAEIQAMWLRRVQTRPADFLKTKFAYQLEMEGEARP